MRLGALVEFDFMGFRITDSRPKVLVIRCWRYSREGVGMELQGWRYMVTRVLAPVPPRVISHQREARRRIFLMKAKLVKSIWYNRSYYTTFGLLYTFLELLNLYFMARLKAFQYLVLKHPTEDDQDTEDSVVVLDGKDALLMAPNLETAMVQVSRMLSDNDVKDLDRLEFFVRPF